MHSIIVFDHLPYSGGYTACLEMVKLFQRGQTLLMGPGTERQTLDPMVQEEFQKLRFISGHTVFGVMENRPVDLKYITMLRHPVNRFLSHYFWWVRLVESGSDSLAAKCRECDVVRNTGSLEAFLNRYLKITDHFEASQLYYLLHKHIPEKELEEARTKGIFCSEIIDIAKTELETAYDQVLITELFEESLVLFAKQYGLAYPERYQKITYSGVKWDELDISQEALEIIAHLCRIELAVYQNAREVFEEKTASLLDSRFLDYKVDCISGDQKFLRHFIHHSDTYQHKDMRKNTVKGRLLCDKLSDRLFGALRLHSSIVEPVAYNTELFSENNQSTTFMIWGTSGKYEAQFKDLVVNCSNNKFRGFIDNNKDKWGKEVDGYVVNSPAEIVAPEKRVDVILIASDFISEIASQIKHEVSYSPLLYY